MSQMTALLEPRGNVRRTRPEKQAAFFRESAAVQTAADRMLRDIAFVLHAVRSVKNSMLKANTPALAGVN
jgi:hypothetical protein